jgi:hypothetical protein
MGELNQPASRRTFRWPGAAREMVRTYLNSATSAMSSKDEHGAQVGLKALITRNRRSVGKSARCLLEVRAAVGSDLEAKLPAVDEDRTTEAARLDRIAFPARSHNAAPSLADIGARHVASARRRLTDGPGLVHETRPGGGAARSRRRSTEVD